MFTVIDSVSSIPAGARAHVYLVVDHWDDWFKFRTMYTMLLYDDNGERHRIGSVKIGQAGLLPAQAAQVLTPGTRVPQLPPTFNALDPAVFFSLGQDEDYYSTLRSLPAHICEYVLVNLCDCAFNLTVFDRHLHQLVMQESLLRSVRDGNVRNRLHRLAHGNAELTRSQFRYTLPTPPLEAGMLVPPAPPPILTFHVEPNSHPPTNVHVLVGRNGAGKTRCIQTLVNAVLGRPSESSPPGVLERIGTNQDEWDFAGLVSVPLARYFDLASRLPLPTHEQIEAYVKHIRKEHGWYKHLPILPPGRPFHFFLDPGAGMTRVVTHGSLRMKRARGSAISAMR